MNEHPVILLVLAVPVATMLLSAAFAAWDLARKPVRR